MKIKLRDVELRVLGVMIEKSLTQPDGYPLTMNAIVLGANQKQNRDPVMHFSEAEVARALQSLMDKELAGQSSPATGARANRFEHNVLERFHWDRREQALMAELILRGRQTAGELRSRAARMTPFEDLEAVMSVIGDLCSGDPRFVEELSREPGRSANRFRQLLSAPEADVAAGLVSGAVLTVPTADEPQRAQPAAPSVGLLERMSRLEAQVARLAEDVERFRRNQPEGVDERDLPRV